MIAWLFKLFLLIEACVLLSLARVLSPGASAAWLAGVLLAIMVLWRLSHGVVSWCVGQALRWRDGRPLDWPNQWKALAKEIAARNGPPTPEQMQLGQSLAARSAQQALISMSLGALALLFMAAAQTL